MDSKLSYLIQGATKHTENNKKTLSNSQGNPWKETEFPIKKKKEKQKKYRQTDRQTDKQINKQKNKQTN